MHLLAEHGNRRYFADQVGDLSCAVIGMEGEPFPCLVWDHKGGASPEGKMAFARQVMAAGCRYAVCAGLECEEWHDAFDFAFVQDHLDEPEEKQDEQFVMTTWHANQSVDEVAMFFVWNTDFDKHEFDRYLVLHLGTGRAERAVDEAVRRHASERAAA
jgi:hypothetical protein